MRGLYVGLDIGASKIRACSSRDPPRIDRKRVIPFPRGGPESVERALIELVLDVSAGESILGIGVGSIGPVDPRHGRVEGAPNAPLKSFRVKEPLEITLGTEVLVVNDCLAAAWGEKIFGAGRDLSDFGYITISSGIGGGFVVDGELIVGQRGRSHEVGHIVIDYSSEVSCGCGGYGHWEALAGGANLPRSLPALARKLSPEVLKTSPLWRSSRSSEVSYEELFALASRGDRVALLLLEELSRIHAAGLASCSSTYDPSVIFLGGSVFLENEEYFLGKLRELLPLFSMGRETPELRRSTFGHDAVLVGALSLLIERPRALR
ncbi:MAG: ROK family protein [Fervidicoccaceae archaeon]